MPSLTIANIVNDKLSSIHNVDNIIYNWPFTRNYNDNSPLSLSVDGAYFLNSIASSNSRIIYRDFTKWILWALDKSKKRPDIDNNQVQFLSYLLQFYKYITYELRAIDIENNYISLHMGGLSINGWFDKYYNIYSRYIQTTTIDIIDANTPLNNYNMIDLCEEIPELEEEEINQIMEEENTFFREYYCEDY